MSSLENIFGYDVLTSLLDDNVKRFEKRSKFKLHKLHPVNFLTIVPFILVTLGAIIWFVIRFRVEKVEIRYPRKNLEDEGEEGEEDQEKEEYQEKQMEYASKAFEFQ